MFVQGLLAYEIAKLLLSQGTPCTLILIDTIEFESPDEHPSSFALAQLDERH
jgi:hypothetical protein